MEQATLTTNNSQNMIYNQLLVKLHVGIFFFLFSVSNIFSQTTIKGKIVDSETNEDLIGATIKIVNSSFGAVTDFNGEFILKTKLNLPFSIEISYIGYELQLIDLKENKFFQIALQSKDLQEGGNLNFYLIHKLRFLLTLLGFF